MSRWLSRVNHLLYDGETVKEHVTVGEGGVVVTSHRVLAFTPDGDGTNYEYVDRPNVVGIEQTTGGSFVRLKQGVEMTVGGSILLGASQLVSLDGLVGTVDLSSSGGPGLGGFLGMMQSLLNVLVLLDEIMLVVGAIGLLAGILLLGVYARTRKDMLVIGVAGGEDIELPLSRDERNGDRLDRALRPE